MSDVDQFVFGVMPGVPLVPKAPRPVFQFPSLKSDDAQLSAGLSNVYRHVAGRSREVGTISTISRDAVFCCATATAESKTTSPIIAARVMQVGMVRLRP